MSASNGQLLLADIVSENSVTFIATHLRLLAESPSQRHQEPAAGRRADYLISDGLLPQPREARWPVESGKRFAE